MFGGYLGQDENIREIKEIKAQLEREPNNEELKKKLKDAEDYHQKRIERALQSYCRL